MHDSPLKEISKYVYGTTRLGDGSIPFDERVAIARAAIDSGAWIHSSHSYGDALQVLKAAFDMNREKLPRSIFKIGWDSVEQVRDVIYQNISPLDLNSMTIGQLCLGGQLAEDFRTGGPSIAALNGIKEAGIVEGFVLEVWPWTSKLTIDALKGGYSQQLVDAFTFYLNPLQRFLSNDLWDLAHEYEIPIIAMRTVCGGSLQKLIENPKTPGYLSSRAKEIQPIYTNSGCLSWPEFCIRFAFSFKQVQATVGSTSTEANFKTFVNSTQDPKPLDPGMVDEILTLQRKWSSEHDQFALPWSM